MLSRWQCQKPKQSHLQLGTRMGQLYRRSHASNEAEALPPSTTVSWGIASSSSWYTPLTHSLKGGSEKKLQFSTRSPRRNAKWMRMRGRMGLPIMWKKLNSPTAQAQRWKWRHRAKLRNPSRMETSPTTLKLQMPRRPQRLPRKKMTSPSACPGRPTPASKPPS